MSHPSSFRTEGATSLGSFTTTYNDHFKPISERQPQLKPRTKAKPVPAVISPLQHLYKTTNSSYGSTVSSQSPFSYLLSLLPSYGIPTSSISSFVGDVGSFLKESGTQEARVAREKRVSFGVEGEANESKEQESKDEPQWKFDVHYEEGAIVSSPCVGLTCCDDFHKSLYKEVTSLDLPAASTSFAMLIYNKDGANGENGTHLWDLSPAVGLQSSSVLQPPSRQCSHCAGETKRPASCCSEMQTYPPQICQRSAQHLACVQPTNYYTGSIRKPPLTEYQDNFSAEWARPKIQQIHHRICPCRGNLHPLL